MSAGAHGVVVSVNRDMDLLAPKFAKAVRLALADCAARDLDAFVYEGLRSQELQALYYARGRTIKPPDRPVTNAHSNLFSWHGYGLAVDVISLEHLWDRPYEWFVDVSKSFKKHGCKWGGDWKQRDLPHFQFGACKPSPSDRARELYAEGGVKAVWEAVGAA